MAAEQPHKYIATRAPKLDGNPVVSWPYGKDNFRRIERSFSVYTGTPATAFRALDEQFTTPTTPKLVERLNYGGDELMDWIFEAYEDLPGPIVPSPAFFDPEKGSVNETNQKIDPDGTEQGTVVLGTGGEASTVIETTYTPLQNGLMNKSVKKFTLPGPELTRRVYESANDVMVTIKTQLVRFDSADPTVGAKFTDLRSEDVVAGVYKRITQRIYPDSILTMGKKVNKGVRRERFVFPAILTGISFGSLSKYRDDGDGGFELARILRTTTPVIRAERVRTVPHRIERTFTGTAPDATAATTGLYVIEPVRNDYRGVLFDVVTGPVLQDIPGGGFYSLSTGSGDPEWPNGGVIETYTPIASTPTATDYLAAVGTEKNIDREFTQIAAGLWAIDNIFVVLI